MPNHETSTYSNTSVCGGTAGERAARLLGSRSPPTPCVPFAEEFQPYTKSKKQYRTMGSHPLHSYLATNRILQLIYDIACIHEREGSVKLAARRGTKRSPSAKGSSLSNDRPDFRVGLGVDFRWLRVKFPLDWKSGILRA